MRLYELLLEARADSLFAKYQSKILARRDHSLGELDAATGLEFVKRLESEFGRYVEWVLLRWLNSDFLSEDIPRVKEVIAQFEQKKRGLEKKDINQYRSLAELEDAVGLLDDVKSNRQVKQEIKNEGIRKIFENDSYMIAELLTKSAACFYGKGTKWCTAAEKNNMFSRYHADGPLYIVLDKIENRKYQLHYESTQFMDEMDKSVPYHDLKKKFPAIEKIEYEAKYSVLESRDPSTILDFIRAVLRQPWPEAESMLIDYPGITVDYCKIAKGRWPEAESKISANLRASVEYAVGVLKDRWPEIEPKLLDRATREAGFLSIATTYVEGCFGKQGWPEFEHVLLSGHIDFDKAACIVDYIKRVKRDRWAEGEARIMEIPRVAAVYAAFTIRGRWPEAESSIMQDPSSAVMYAIKVLERRWPEAEPIIKKDSIAFSQYSNHFTKESSK